MNQPGTPDHNGPVERRRESRFSAASVKTLGAVTLIVGFVVWSHLESGVEVFHSTVSSEHGWRQFRSSYGVDKFGEDSYFSRAAQNGYNLFYYTYKYAGRFTRKSATDANNACASCHRVEDIAYGFVNADRFDPKLGKRVSFEER